MKRIIRILSYRGFCSKGGSDMNLTELQIQLREMEEHLSTLQGEIEKMKPQPEEEKKKTYEAITKIARKYPLKERNISNTVMAFSKPYLSCLSYIALADTTNMNEKTLYLCRLAQSMKNFSSAEDIIRIGMEVDKDYFEKACYELKEVKESFLIDALIIANIAEEASKDTLTLIADIAQFMECKKEEVQVMALLAKTILTNNKKYLPTSWLESQRVYVGKICTGVERIERETNSSSPTYRMFLARRTIFNTFTVTPCKVETKKETGSIVKKGEPFCVYKQKMTYKEIEEAAAKDEELMKQYLEGNVDIRYKELSLTAPCDGKVFYVEHEERDTKEGELRKYIAAYVVSYFDDYTEFSKKYKNK